MSYKRKNVPPGPKSPFNLSLGLGVQATFKLPQPINQLIREKPVKQLLNWMAMDSSFKEKILDQVPSAPPPEEIEK